MKWFFEFNQKDKIPYILTNIILIFFDSIGFVVPILIGYIVDRVTIYHDYNQILFFTILIIVFVIIKVMGSYFSFIKLRVITNRMSSNIKKLCYQKLNQLDYYYYEHQTHGELMTNFTSDLNYLERHLYDNIKTIGAIILTFSCSFIYLLTIHIPFTFLLLTPGILVGIVSYCFLKKIEPRYEKSRNLNSEVNDFISDNIEANRVVKTFAMEKSEIKAMKQLNGKLTNQNIENALIEDDFYYVHVPFLSYLMNVLFLIGGGYLFIKGKITLGELVIFNSYLSTLKAPFIRLSGLLNSVERYKISKSRINNLLMAKPKITLTGTKPLNSLKVPIEFKNVSIIYDKKKVLENFNLKIEPNETIAFIGKTGSGKSSIANLLLGFVIPEKGEILINGVNYLDYNMKDIREKVGYVTQNAFLFSDTIYNNISYGNTNITKEEARTYANIASCTYIDHLKEGMDTIIGEKGVGLSGGEKQRLSLARAIAVKPDILLLDDITSALDIETEEKINESIRNLDYQSTKIIIASKVVSVMNADKIIVLDHGKVVESGTHQELFDKKGYYYELCSIEKGEI